MAPEGTTSRALVPIADGSEPPRATLATPLAEADHGTEPAESSTTATSDNATSDNATVGETIPATEAVVSVNSQESHA